MGVELTATSTECGKHQQLMEKQLSAIMVKIKECYRSPKMVAFWKIEDEEALYRIEGCELYFSINAMVISPFSCGDGWLAGSI